MQLRFISILACLGISGRASAQAPPAPSATPPTPTASDSDKAEADKPAEKPSVDDRLETLEEDLEDLQDENKDLQEQLDDLRQRAAVRPRAPLNAMNPQITAFLNGATRFDDTKVYTPDGSARIDDRLFMRTMEVDFRAAVDPYADAVAILSLENEPGGGFEADLEEGYVIVKRLPILESAPLGLKLKLGRYRAPIGSINRVHMHDLPWTTRPLPIARLLGTENGEFFESGFNAVGADAEVILPEIIPDVVMELNADVVDGGDLAISDGSVHHPAYLAHYNAFFTVHDSHDFNIGASAYSEVGSLRAQLVGGDFLYKWKPLRAGEFHSVVLGGEVLAARRTFRLDGDGDGTPEAVDLHSTPLAWYAFAQYQLSWHVYVGGRYDYAQDIVDDSLATRVAAGYVSYYTSEFLRFRLGYEHRWSDIPAENGVDSVIAEINVVFGSHPIEPYWVNR